MPGTGELGTSLATAAGALTLRQGLEVHGEGQLLGQRRALPVVPCQHVAHHQPEGHQQHPQGVGQDTLGHKAAVGVPVGTERGAQASGCGWPVLLLAGCPPGTHPGEDPCPPNQSKRGVPGCCSLWGGTLLVTANWGHCPIAGLWAAQHLPCQLCSPRQREGAPGVPHSRVPTVLGLGGTPMCSWGHRRVLQL